MIFWTLLVVLYIALFVSLGMSTFRKGHQVLFWVGIIFPVLWIVGALMARVLAVLGYDVVLLERGAHPRFAIGESTTPLANLSLERLARRYGERRLVHRAEVVIRNPA